MVTFPPAPPRIHEEQIVLFHHDLHNNWHCPDRSCPCWADEREDELVHTKEHPFCSDVHCPCHDVQDGPYYQLICRPLLGGLMTAEEANRLYFGEQL